MGRRQPPSEPPDDDEVDDVWVGRFAEIGLIGFRRLLHSAALDALLDEYLRTHPRPDEQADPTDPALD